MNRKLKITYLATITYIILTMFGCNNSGGNNGGDGGDTPGSKINYETLFDPVSDIGQYTLPETQRSPKRYWSCVNALKAVNRNEPNLTGHGEGLQYHLLCQSIAGLVNKAVSENRSEIGVWLYDHEERDSYKTALSAVNAMGITEQGRQTGIELATINYHTEADGFVRNVRNLFDGYVLTDVVNNPESNIVASVASHVHNAIIVDVRDKQLFDDAGYTMAYDARNKTTRDAWNEFKNKCNNEGLVVMPLQTGELRDFAIQNKYFVININKVYENPNAGLNSDVYEEILAWLKPGAPIYGWEQVIDESKFIAPASSTGHIWIPNDWTYNIAFTSLDYKRRQPASLANVINPKNIDYTLRKHFYSYYLSDGDNVQWMMNRFVDEFYLDPYANEMCMGFGIPVINIAMQSPDQFKSIMNKQKPNYTLIEALGGGYMYVDTYGENVNRASSLKTLAERVAASMRQHRIKVLGLHAKNIASTACNEAYQAFIDADDQLEGIIVVNYGPYAGGDGKILWIKNKAGYHIPVIAVKYALWNHEGNNVGNEGSPAYLARLMKENAQRNGQQHAVISLHAWSFFRDIGQLNDESAENQNGNLKGASAARLIKNHLDDNYQAVTVQELIWRIRMKHYPVETQKYLDELE